MGLWRVVLLASVVLFRAFWQRSNSASASVTSAPASKKVCHTVTKKVKGKKKKVKVCKNVKPKPTATPKATTTPTLTPIVPSPDAITPHPDMAKAVSKTVATTGGTVTATGADGTTYTLTLPAA